MLSLNNLVLLSAAPVSDGHEKDSYLIAHINNPSAPASSITQPALTHITKGVFCLLDT